MEKLRGLTLGLYDQGDPDRLYKKDMGDKFYEIMKELGSDEDDYKMQIPNTATYEQLEQLLECLKIEFFKIVEIDIE